jgi:ketosteroid isomerase-like protein
MVTEADQGGPHSAQKRWLPVLVAGIAGTGALSMAFGASPSQNDPVADIRALLDLQVASWNRGKLDEFVTTYWNSPLLVFQSGADRTSGWEAMRDRYRKRYQGEGKEMGRLDFRDLDIIMLGPDSAFARGRWRLTMSDGKQPGGLFTVILRKLPEGWKIVHDHTSD